METKTKETGELLNELIRVNSDRIEVYERGSSEIQDSQLKNLFTNLGLESRKFKNELVKEVAVAGSRPAEGTTTAGPIFRVWADVRIALSTRDKKAIMTACEKAEIEVRNAYDETISEKTLTPATREVIIRHRSIMMESYEKIKAMLTSPGSL